MNEFMKICVEEANNGVLNNDGGPFGACIIDSNNNVIASSHNTVLKDNDPTAHAEVNAIRKACNKLKTYNLEGYTLFTNCEPCPMCLSAIIWSNIKTVYYGCTRKDAEKIGFRDNAIYDFINNKNKDLIKLENIDRENCIKDFLNYDKTLY